jgi:hypothetical protein
MRPEQDAPDVALADAVPADGAHLHKNGRLFPPNYLHDSWLDYLYWNTELEP